MPCPPLPLSRLDSAIRKLRTDTRIASINDLPIAKSGRLCRWPAGRRPNDHTDLTEL
jgi:nuclear transport factor 2 (NTF2) superfamily protein